MYCPLIHVNMRVIHGLARSHAAVEAHVDAIYATACPERLRHFMREGEQVGPLIRRERLSPGDMSTRHYERMPVS